MPDETAGTQRYQGANCSNTDVGGYSLPHPPTQSPEGYLIQDEIGRGGMGIVCRAMDISLGREVAIKILSPQYHSGSSSAARFVEEARITGQLQHPGIPAVHQVGTLPDGRPFLAMKLIKGRTLDELLKARHDIGHDRARFLSVYEAIGQAVGYAHAHNVIHRDLKPLNVMVGAFGEVQVMDWGLAKLTGGSVEKSQLSQAETIGTEIRSARGDDERTQAGSILGTPAYMPPEQAIGAIDQLDARSDVFGLGAILCVILTGRPPYVAADGESTRQLAARGRLGEVFEKLDASGAEPDLVSLCKRCLSAEKEERPRNAGEVAAAVASLRAAADDRARKAELDQRAAEVRAGEDRKRRRVVTIAGGIVVCALLAGTIVSLWQARRAELSRVDAVAEATNARIAEGNERTAREDANREKDEAIRQEKSATATKNFLKSVLLLPSASYQLSLLGKTNPNITLRETLIQATKLIDGRFPQQPLIEAELRGTIASALQRLGAYSEAVPFAEAALKLRERELGSDHIDTLAAVEQLFYTYHFQGRFDLSEPLINRVIHGYERVLGAEHERTLFAQVMLGLDQVTHGKHQDAQTLLVRVRATSDRVLGPNNKTTLFAVYNLGLLLGMVGRGEEAVPLLKRAAEGYEKIEGPEGSYTIESISILGHNYMGRGMLSEAGPLLERAYEVRNRTFVANHPLTLASVVRLGIYYDMSANAPKAARMWSLAYENFEKLPDWVKAAGLDHWAKVRVGSIRCAEKQYAEAERLLLEGYEGMSKRMLDRSTLRQATDYIIWLYSETGQSNKTAKWQAERAKYVPSSREAAPPPRVTKEPSQLFR